MTAPKPSDVVPIRPGVLLPSGPDSLERHLDWLYGPGSKAYPDAAGQPCRCEHKYKGLGMLHGISMGKGWVRMNTHPYCPHHGFQAAKQRKQRNREARR